MSEPQSTRTLGRLCGLIAMAMGIYLHSIAAGCAAQPEHNLEHNLEAWGIQYKLDVRTTPRPNRIHVLRVDLAAGKAHMKAITAADPDGEGPAEAALTDPRVLADNPQVLALVNCNPFDSFLDAQGKRNRDWYEGQLVDITGLAAHDGRLISTADRGRAAIWSDKDGLAHVDVLPPDGEVVEGVGGWGVILKDGQVIPRLVNVKAKTDADPSKQRLNPVTGIGVDQTGQTLWLVVVDGRQKGYSEGVDHYELSVILRDLGCWNGALMDGGGSTIMCIADAHGRLQIVNSPSGRTPALTPKIRPLPVVLTVQRKSAVVDE